MTRMASAKMVGSLLALSRRMASPRMSPMNVWWVTRIEMKVLKSVCWFEVRCQV